MRMTLKLPVLGDTTQTAMITEWLVAVGDTVTKGQSLVWVEADKAVVEVPSPVNGVIRELRAAPEDELDIGDPLVVIDTVDIT